MQTPLERCKDAGNRFLEGLARAPRAIGSGIGRGLKALGHFFAQFVRDIIDGDIWVKLSLILCGAGYFGRRQYVRAFLVTLLQAAFIVCIPEFFWPYMSKYGNLGSVKFATTTETVVVNGRKKRVTVQNDYDHSFKILLFGIIGFVIVALAVYLYIKNLHIVRLNSDKAKKGAKTYTLRRAFSVLRAKGEQTDIIHQSAGHKRRHRLRALKADREEYRAETMQKTHGAYINNFADDIGDLRNKRFNVTMLTLPVLGVTVFTVIPLIIMILIAFTNYDKQHLVPANLFTWVGLDNFRSIFTHSISVTFGYAFGKVIVWTIVWAFLATFTNFYFGILLAMFINNKKTRCKQLWRTCFMVAIAVPQFVSLMLVRNFFADTGIVNTLCAQWGVTQALKDMGLVSQSLRYIPFLTDPNWAKVMIILINMWIGIPYLMLIATGILMNIPSDILESAQIDGANGFQRFRKITMPYMRFVLGPYLVSSVVSNINNFNVIYLLSQDVYVTQDQLLANSNAKEIDLLVTWLYRLTQEQNNYKMASVLGIMIFVVSALFTLVAFRSMTKGDKEERFQ